MVLSSDHLTGATGKTVAVELSKGPAAGGTAAAGTVTELDSANLPGMYQIALTTVDTAVSGDLGFHCTAAGCDPTDFVDQVQAQVFTDLTLTGGGLVSISSNIKQNTALNGFMFTMTVNGAPTAGLTVTGQRNFGSGFSALANSGSITGLGSGDYAINLAAADLNSASVLLRFTASGADDRNIYLITQP